MDTDRAAVAAILDFWFGPPGADGALPKREEWFRGGPAFDTRVAEVLGPWHTRAAAGALDRWADTADGALALVLLLDQAPRNLFRGDPRAFATDAHARQVAAGALDRGFDRDMQVVQRLFLYLPFEHGEDLADQDRSVALFAALGDADYLDYAQRHRDIIVRFGRFPHRNAVLGRASSTEEAAFLTQPGSSF
ncbi:MAG: DUF924 domain-containing protein [Hyphomicrobiales bacterium]|nr:DUF924 domain-containing protein [Hyphomicrobiales bacterium]